MTNWNFYIATFGCKVNQYESQQLREAWTAAGGNETLRPEEADYILINSCAITARAERNARNAVNRLRQISPEAKIILCGCAAQFYEAFRPRKNARLEMPDLCVPQAKKEILLAGPPGSQGESAGMDQISSYSRARPVIKIQDGCSHCCSYCIVPQTRGKPVSRPRTAILKECLDLAEAGYGELVLSGINLRLYEDSGNFWQFLGWLDRQLAERCGAPLRLRISSVDPAMLAPEALDVIAASSLLCPHLHLSLQHASASILVKMRRNHYDVAAIIAFCQELKRVWPLYGLGADLIAGFPGETEEDLKALHEALQALPLTYAHIFPYSRRQGTVAAGLPGQICRREKEERASRLRSIVSVKQKNFWQKLLHLPEMRIAPDRIVGPGRGHGVNEFYVPCHFDWPANQEESKGLPRARPTGICEDGLVVTWLRREKSEKCPGAADVAPGQKQDCRHSRARIPPGPGE